MRCAASSKNVPETQTIKERIMDNTTLLIIIIILFFVFGGGYYGRGRWY